MAEALEKAQQTRTQTPDESYVKWLVEISMLHNARLAARRYAGQSRMWQRPYAEGQPRAATKRASVWFTAYPAAIITPPHTKVLATLARPELWSGLATLGVQAIHIGPTKRSGGLEGSKFTATIDGNFDRIGWDIDPEFGDKEDFVALSLEAAAHNAVVIDDVIPAHTGKGPDFRLAEMAYGDYPGLYHMVCIPEADWTMLPEVPEGQDSVNLLKEQVDALAEKRYIVGRLNRTIFLEPGVKDTDWSATAPVTGPDGVTRRWVYLHYFKAGQPSLNWLDPTFAAQQMIVGDALNSRDELKAVGLRLDANGFLGIEARPGDHPWSEGHPLSVVGNQLIAGMIRKAGGFTFQELNLTVDDIARMSKGGADLSYDFITRPAYHHALLTGNTEFLRLMLQIMRSFGIEPVSLIHALQNHDELTLELMHFYELHRGEVFFFQGDKRDGGTVRGLVRDQVYERLTEPNAPYNLRFTDNGVACTTASVITAALGISDLNSIGPEETRRIQKVHLLLAMYNAFQPGVFALSGWDVVGALPLDPQEVAEFMADGDTRWINRGAYDLMDLDPAATKSCKHVPKARSLYGSLAEQLKNPESFAMQLKHLLDVRQKYKLAVGRQLDVPNVNAPGLLVMVHELPEQQGTQVTALNFGSVPIEETIKVDVPSATPIFDMLREAQGGSTSENGTFLLQLEPYEGKSLRMATRIGDIS